MCWAHDRDKPKPLSVTPRYPLRGVASTHGNDHVGPGRPYTRRVREACKGVKPLDPLL